MEPLSQYSKDTEYKKHIFFLPKYLAPILLDNRPASYIDTEQSNDQSEIWERGRWRTSFSEQIDRTLVQLSLVNIDARVHDPDPRPSSYLLSQQWVLLDIRAGTFIHRVDVDQLLNQLPPERIFVVLAFGMCFIEQWERLNNALQELKPAISQFLPEFEFEYIGSSSSPRVHQPNESTILWVQNLTYPFYLPPRGATLITECEDPNYFISDFFQIVGADRDELVFFGVTTSTIPYPASWVLIHLANNTMIPCGMLEREPRCSVEAMNEGKVYEYIAIDTSYLTDDAEVLVKELPRCINNGGQDGWIRYFKKRENDLWDHLDDRDDDEFEVCRLMEDPENGEFDERYDTEYPDRDQA